MLFQSQSHSLRPLTTAHLAQTMTLLELTGNELRQKIESELANNPALELIDLRRCPTCHRRLPDAGSCPICSLPVNTSPDLPVIFISPRTDFSPSSSSLSYEDISPEERIVQSEDLPTYVLRQIAPELNPDDRPLAAHILTSLDEDGLFRTSLLEIARYHHVPLERLIPILHLIQRADPTGVGCSSPEEACLVQLETLAENTKVPPLAARAISEGIDLLSRHAYHELGQLLSISESQAKELAKFISENLNPYPARAHWGDFRHGTQPQDVYHDPDVIITRLQDRDDSPLVVEIVSPYAGALRVNPLFRDALSQAPSEKVEEWQSDMEQASLLVKCLQQRNHTLVRLMQRVVVLQRHFILDGDACLLPVTRAFLASELNVHESTISRAVSGKAVQLPNRRIIPLDKFFDPSLHIRAALRLIIAQEARPLSDTQLARLLNKQGFPVARRTVAKYRAMEGILSARFRQLQTPTSRAA